MYLLTFLFLYGIFPVIEFSAIFGIFFQSHLLSPLFLGRSEERRGSPEPEGDHPKAQRRVGTNCPQQVEGGPMLLIEGEGMGGEHPESREGGRREGCWQDSMRGWTLIGGPGDTPVARGKKV